MMLSHGCIYELARGGRCGKDTLPGRHLCADHVTAVCGCGRQAVRETRLTRTPLCTQCSSTRNTRRHRRAGEGGIELHQPINQEG